jgi:hypothetical protein
MVAMCSTHLNKLVDISEIYYEMSSSTPSDKTSHYILLHSIYINNMLTKINYILLLPQSNEEWHLSNSVNHVITLALWMPDMNMLL